MSTIKISQLGNLTTVQGNTIVPVVGNVAGTLTTLQSNVAQLQTYILGTVVTDLANLTVSTTANAAVQSGAIADVTTAWQANATTQLSQITGANAAIVTANTALKGYTDAAITTVTNSVIGANAAIVTANTALKGYVDAANTIQSNEITAISNSVIGANAAIVTANTALKGYVDAANTIQTNQITAISNSVIGANAAIVTANTALKGYVDANNATQLTSINNITNGSVGFGNIIPITDTTYTLGAESYRWNTVHTATVSTATVNLPLSASLFTASVDGVDYAILSGATSGGAVGAALITPSANIVVTNYIAINETYANVVVHNANTAITHTWQFTQDGDIKLPASGDILDSVGNSAITSFTMGNAAHWTTPVTTIAAALDQIAERLWTIENPV